MTSTDPRDRLPRVLSSWDASMLVVASVVGSGIFFTAGPVAALLPSAGLVLAAWIVGALVSLAGAFANAELAAMFPRAGGDYVYLREGVHRSPASWSAGSRFFRDLCRHDRRPLAVVFGEQLAGVLGLGRGGVLAIASLVIGLFSALNVRGTRWATSLNNVASIGKIAALVLFVAIAPVVGEGSFAPWSGSFFGVADPGEREGLWLRFGQALSPVLFSYLGWNASVYVASEVRDPQRSLPRSLFTGLAICAALYLAVNVVYLYALPPESLRSSEDAGRAAAEALLGPVGGRWVGGFVLLSVLGTLNATVLIGPRIVYAMALDGLFPRAADRVHAGFATPSGAIGVQALVSIGLVLFLESFPRALDFTVFAIVLATSADVLALFALRRRQPDRARPYRAWGHPWVPGVYLVVNLAIGAAIAAARPRECAVTFALLAVGLLLYGAMRRAAGGGGDGQPA